MPELKPEDCHYYEPNIEDFDWCPLTKGFIEVGRLICETCHHRPEDGTREESDGKF